jgi:hypothetical protein
VTRAWWWTSTAASPAAPEPSWSAPSARECWTG